MRILLFLLLSLVTATSSSAQLKQCGANLNELSDRERQNALSFIQQERGVSRSGAFDSVAITVHIIESRSINSVELTAEDIEKEMASVNAAFSPSGVTFFMCGSPRSINGDGSYNFESGGVLNEQYYVPNTINVYYSDDVQGSGGQGVCGFAQFPFVGTPETRFIMMDKSCSTDGATLAHELGHFYGLFHTHETALGREFVDGSNCSSSGDRLCDTPADPDLSSPNVMSGCSYVGRLVDPKGSQYIPLTNNLMSYAPSRCVRSFTDEQAQVIREVHENENDYLISNCDFYPDFSIAADLDELIIRSDDNIAIDYNFELKKLEEIYDVTFKISFAEEVDDVGFLLHEERLQLTPESNQFSSSFELDLPFQPSTGTYFLKAVLDSDNEVIELTKKNNLAITNTVVDNSSLEDVELFPNPAQDELKLFFRNDNARGSLSIRIFSYDGRLVLEQEGFKSAEEYFQFIDVSNLQTGLYVVTVDFEKVSTNYSFKFMKK